MKQKISIKRLAILSLIVSLSTGFSIEVEASESYTKLKIVKEQSPIAEVVKLLDNFFN